MTTGEKPVRGNANMSPGKLSGGPSEVIRVWRHCCFKHDRINLARIDNTVVRTVS